MSHDPIQVKTPLRTNVHNKWNNGAVVKSLASMVHIKEWLEGGDFGSAKGVFLEEKLFLIISESKVSPWSATSWRPKKTSIRPKNKKVGLCIFCLTTVVPTESKHIHANAYTHILLTLYCILHFSVHKF